MVPIATFNVFHSLILLSIIEQMRQVNNMQNLPFLISWFSHTLDIIFKIKNRPWLIRNKDKINIPFFWRVTPSLNPIIAAVF